MKRKIVSLLVLFLVLLPLHSVQAQEPTSRHIPFTLQTSLTPDTTQEVEVQLWDMATGGTLIFSEAYTGENALPVDSAGFVSFRFGSRQTPAGLNPAHFPSGSSRYLDVIEVATQASVLPSGRIPLFANAFALSGGGSGGGISDVTGSAPVVVSNPTPDTRNVALGPITDANIADNAVSTPKIADGAVNLAKLAAGSVDSSKIVNGSVGSAAVNSGQVQLRVTGNCPPGSSIRTIDANGGVTCETGSGGGIGGSGTVNQIPKFTSATTIGNSVISESGGNVQITPNSTGFALRIDQGPSGQGLLQYVNTISSDKTVLGAHSNVVGLEVKGNGNVGIGLVRPEFKLEVGGRMRVWDGGGSAGIWFRAGPPINPFDAAFVGMQNDSNVGLFGNTGAGWSLTMNTTTGGVVTQSSGPGLSRPALRADNTNANGIGIWSTTNSNDANLVVSNNGSGDLIRGFCAGCGNPAFRVLNNGTTVTRVLEITGGSDLAEHFEVAEGVKPGMVVAIDPQNAGKLSIARGAYNRRAAGVISGANNLSAGMVLPDLSGAKQSVPVALSGRVWVYCDATRYAIKPGDLLTTSAMPGHAMKVTNHVKAQGAIIGKAMTGLKSGRGLVLVLVTLQ